MNAIPQGIDPKTIERVKKLLALAADGGATEAEAALAMDRAQKIMMEHGLSIATVEASGGMGESREKAESRGRAHKPWMRELMEALATSSFVHASHTPGRRSRWDGELHPARWTLIGRQSAVVQVQLMHEYLVRTVDRVARDRGTPSDERFKAGMGERLVERLVERHSAAMAEQRRQAGEAKARASHPSAAPGNALVVVMEDYAQRERDLNEDLRRGLKPGTTAANREQELRDREERQRMREQKKQELEARGFTEDEIFYVLIGYDEDEAKKLAAKKSEPKPPETEEQAAKRRAREEKESEEFWERQRRARDREHERRAHPSYRAGRSEGERVGLDTQVGRKETRRLS